MFNKISIGAVAACLASALIVPSASAFNTSLQWEIADAFAHNATTGTNTAYEWFVQPIKLNFDAELRDGTWSDGRPYRTFSGTDASPNGHCLQINFLGGLAPPQSLDIYVNDHGTNKFLYSVDPSREDAIRLWVNKNTGGAGSTLPWTIYFLPGETDWGGDLDIAIRRIELGKSACATNQGPDPWSQEGALSWPWISVEGNSSAYTVTTGHG